MKKNKLITSLLLTFFILIHFSHHCQVNVTAQTEIDGSSDWVGHEFFLSEDRNMLDISLNHKLTSNKMKEKYEFYDTKLKVVKTIMEIVSFESNPSLKTYHSDNKVYRFRRYGNNFSLISADLNNNSVSRVDGTLDETLSPKEMVVLNNHVFISVISNKKPKLLKINWKTGDQELLPISVDGYDSKNLIIQNIEKIAGSSEFFISVREDGRKSTPWIKAIIFDANGNEISSALCEGDNDHNLITLQTSKLEENSYYLTGTFARQSGSSAVGFFTSKCESGATKFITYHPFAEFSDSEKFLDMNDRLKRKKKLEKKGMAPEELDIDSELLSHGILPIGDEAIFIGEAYKPTYINVSTSSQQTERIFDGNKYTHAIVARIASDGTLKWHTLFELQQILKPKKKRLFMTPSIIADDQLSISYTSFANIHEKILSIPDGKLVSEKKSEALDTQVEKQSDEIKTTFDMVNWYDNVYWLNVRQDLRAKILKLKVWPPAHHTLRLQEYN